MPDIRRVLLNGERSPRPSLLLERVNDSTSSARGLAIVSQSEEHARSGDDRDMGRSGERPMSAGVQGSLFATDNRPGRSASAAQPEALPSEIQHAFDELVGLLQIMDHAIPIDVDTVTSAITMAFGLILSDETTAELAREVIQQGARSGRPGYVDAAHALSAYGRHLAPWTMEMMSELPRPSPALELLGTARITAVTKFGYRFGDLSEYLLSLAYPGVTSDEVPGYMITVDAVEGSMAIAATVVPDVEDIVAQAAAADDIVTVDDVPVEVALGAIEHALWVFDHTIGAAEALDDEELLTGRPFLEYLLHAHPHQVVEEPSSSPSERGQLVERFGRWVEENSPEFALSAWVMAPLMVDFAVDRMGGDPLRWSPRVTVAFLQFAAERGIAPPEDMADLPDLARLLVRWAHQQNGWPESDTEATMSAVDSIIPVFHAELEARAAGAGSESIAGPAVDHPEPLNTSGIDPKLLDRVEAIAATASTAALTLFDDEFVTLVRRLVSDAARHPRRPLARGKTDIWASAMVYGVAQLNDIPGGWNSLAMPAAGITDRLAGAATTIATKARELRKLLDLDAYGARDRFRHSAAAFDPFEILSRQFAEIGSTGGEVIGGRFPGVEIGGPHLRVVRDVPKVGPVDPASLDGDYFVIRASLNDITPQIWRRFRLPVDATFAGFHQLLQLGFGWYDCHLHSFEFAGESIGPTGDGFGFEADHDEATLRLCDVVGPGSDFIYLYDFGDGWEHRLVVEGLQQSGDRSELPDFGCLDGARACPPEDCGGPWGYQDLLEALADNKHPRRQELAEPLPPGFDPKAFDAQILNDYLTAARW